MTLREYQQYALASCDLAARAPAHWRVIRLRHAVELNPSVPRAKLDPGEQVSFLPMEAIGEDGSLDLSRSCVVAEASSGYSYFADGDVVVAKITPCFENGKGSLIQGLTGGHGFGTTELIVLRPYSGLILPRFLYYVVHSSVCRDLGTAYMYGAGGQKRVPDDFVRNLKVAIPSAPEQHQIVDFLDRETAQIDVLVVEQRRLMELLHEKRQAIVSHAVTKGLNPGVSMKPSCVEWLGDVPTHWTVTPIRRAARLESGHTPSRQHPEYWVDCTVPWFTLADVWQIREGKADYVFETKEKVSELGLANSAARLLPKGTVMLSRTASVGFAAIMGTDMATTQDFANWVCGERLLPEYLLYVFRAMHPEFRRLMMGSTHNTIYMPDIQTLRLALPPLDEQREIVTQVRALIEQLDGLTSEVQRAESLLLERRSALISAAVTGQVDVRQLAGVEAA